MGIECLPNSDQLPNVYKINHLAMRLSGSNPDGVIEGDININLSSHAVRRLENLISYRASSAQQTTALAHNWHQVRTVIDSLQNASDSGSINAASLSLISANPDMRGDTDESARIRAGILIESAQILIQIMDNDNPCESVTFPGQTVETLPRFAANNSTIRSERNHIPTIAGLYIRMGGEEDDGGLPDGRLNGSVTITDANLRAIDEVIGYSVPFDPENPGSSLRANWHATRGLIQALRNDSNAISQTSLGETITDQSQREAAAVLIQSVVGIIRIINSEDWQAGRAYAGAASPAPDTGPIVAADSGPGRSTDAGPRETTTPPPVEQTGDQPTSGRPRLRRTSNRGFDCDCPGASVAGPGSGNSVSGLLRSLLGFIGF
jgi:hypothetical protein